VLAVDDDAVEVEDDRLDHEVLTVGATSIRPS
jgi:hypothetical protein